MHSVLISLKPCYADLVFKGLKRVEFRRRIFVCEQVGDVFVYVTSPVKKLCGGFRIGEIWWGDPGDVWDSVSEFAGIMRQDFDTYFEGSKVAYALEIKDVWEYEESISLKTLRSRFSDFVVPQSWRYIREEEYWAFEGLRQSFSFSKSLKQRKGVRIG